MRAVAGKVLTLPDQIIDLAALGAIGPQVRPPQEQRCFHLAPLAVEVEFCGSLDLILNEPPDRKRRLIGVRFRVERSRGVTPVDTAAQISDAQIGETCFGIVQYRQRIALEFLAMLL